MPKHDLVRDEDREGTERVFPIPPLSTSGFSSKLFSLSIVSQPHAFFTSLLELPNCWKGECPGPFYQAQTVSMANGKHMFPGGPAANTQEGILEPHTGEPGCEQTEKSREPRNIQPQGSRTRRKSRECCWLRGQRGSDRPGGLPSLPTGR